MNLKPVIVPAKVLANGKHRIRIAISHHGATRYFLTRFVVDNPNCISNGVVVGIPNASYTNQVLMQTMSNIYKAYDSIDDADYLSCSQLKEQIEEKMKGDKPVTLFEMIDTYNEYRKQKLTHILYPASVLTAAAVMENEEIKTNAFKNAIPEFKRFNIVESEVRNVN